MKIISQVLVASGALMTTKWVVLQGQVHNMAEQPEFSSMSIPTILFINS